MFQGVGASCGSVLRSGVTEEQREQIVEVHNRWETNERRAMYPVSVLSASVMADSETSRKWSEAEQLASPAVLSCVAANSYPCPGSAPLQTPLTRNIQLIFGQCHFLCTPL